MTSTTQETLDALDEAGRLLAPILQSEAYERGILGRSAPSVHVSMDGHFSVHGFIGEPGAPETVIGHADCLSAAFVQFLANRSDKLAEIEREEQIKREFEAFKAQQVAA